MFKTLRNRIFARRVTRTAAISRVAGLAGSLRQDRRGSFLIMVVGTLALVAVITVVYVAIGRSDRQTSAAAERVEERKDIPEFMRDYLAGIIADDVFDVVYLGERAPNPSNPATNIPVFVREAWDYPSAAYEVTLPNPFGEITVPLTVGATSQAADPRRYFTPTGNYTGTDPWLASTEPALLNFDGASLTGETVPADHWRERLDWAHTSIVSPDGARVNLFNLRGNFDATPAEMRGQIVDGDSRGVPPTLYLDEPDTGNRGNQTDYGTLIQLPYSPDAVPAELNSRLRFAVYPKFDPSYGVDQGLHMPYQWADADGDGIYDSTWFEMVEDRDPSDDYIRQLIEPDGDYRYFFAVHITDLSARINVNTATDNSLAPAREDPFGLTPAAVDLRRVLTYEDRYSDVRLDFDTPGDGDYGIGPNYHFQQPEFPRPADPASTENYADYDLFNSFYVGATGYDAHRTILDLGINPGPNYQGLVDADTTGDTNREFAIFDPNTPNPYWNNYAKLNGQPLAPTDYYELFAGYGLTGGTGDLGNNAVVRSGVFRPFTVESLFDLLAFNSVNDDRNLSPLEVALDGRADPNIVTPVLAQRFGPLRSNRSTELERTRFVFDRLRPLFLDEAKAAMYTDIRQLLTTHSGGRPIAPTRIVSVQQGNRFYPDPAQLALDTDDLRSTKDTLFDTASNLFRFYADALAPYSDLTLNGSSVWDVVANPKHATLFYGYQGPQLAVRTAAHLAINMRDAYDNGSDHSIRTLILNGSQTFRDNDLDINLRNPLYPWRVLDLDANSGSLATRLPDLTASPIAGIPNAVNIHGVEAQPFLIEAGALVMYTDTPEALGGDDDTNPILLNGTPVPRDRPSINGEVPNPGKDDNPDFLCEALAFQLHNPFDESITLSGTSADGEGIDVARRELYYIQYGDNYFKVTDVAGGAEAEITLAPGETQTLYVLSQHPETIARRIHRITRDSEYGGMSLADEQQRVRDWIDTQFGVDAIQIAPFDPSTGVVSFPANNNLDLRSVTDLQQGAPEDRRVVKLWRVERPELDAVNGGYLQNGIDETTQNFAANDTLVDRLRDPGYNGASEPTLDRRLWEPGDNQQNKAGEIPDADRGFEPPDPGALNGDNRGLSLTRYAVVRRNGDPNAASVSLVPDGGIPAYCIETKDQNGAAANDTDQDSDSRKNLRINDFSGIIGDDTLDGLMSKQSGSGNSLANLVLPSISTDAEQKTTDPKQNLVIKKIPNNLDSLPYQGGLSGGFYSPPLYPEARLDNSEFNGTTGVSTMRIADVLLPLGIGAHQIPDPAYHGGNEDVEWTTLSEALAMALFYERPEDTDINTVYFQAFDPVTGRESLLDRGNLQVAAFVPFFDNDENGVFDLLTDSQDRRWGLGVPAAATLVDRFTSLDRRFGSLTSPTVGTLNINTVSRQAARSIPGLSPNEATGPDTTSNWWWTGTDFDWRSDIATTLVSYRDRLAMFPRAIDYAEPDNLLNFRDAWDDLTLPNPVRLAPGSIAGVAPGTIQAELDGDNARQGAVGVRGLRETPGFRSLGELFLLRDLGYPISDPNYPSPHDIDRLGYDADSIDIEGVDSVAYTNGEDEIDDDFDERLALANAALSSTNVRSDYFAVWFVMHGYRESDVNGLGNDDPLIPSVARRFLMVVDRSNVIEPGDKPRIVLFKEVPL